MSTIEELETQIRAIRDGEEYRSLIIKHRGPLEERRLKELNLRITAMENQKKPLMVNSAVAATLSVVKPVPTRHARPIRIDRVGVVKARSKASPGTEVVDKKPPSTSLPAQKPDHSDKAASKVMKMAAPRNGRGASKVAASVQPVVTTPPKPKLSPAIRKGTAPLEEPAPETKTSGKFSIMNKTGRSNSRGSLKAAPVQDLSRKASMSKPANSLIKTTEKNPKKTTHVTKEGDEDELDNFDSGEGDFTEGFDELDDLSSVYNEIDNISFEEEDYENLLFE